MFMNTWTCIVDYALVSIAIQIKHLYTLGCNVGWPKKLERIAYHVLYKSLCNLDLEYYE